MQVPILEILGEVEAEHVISAKCSVNCGMRSRTYGGEQERDVSRAEIFHAVSCIHASERRSEYGNSALYFRYQHNRGDGRSIQHRKRNRQPLQNGVLVLQL